MIKITKKCSIHCLPVNQTKGATNSRMINRECLDDMQNNRRIAYEANWTFKFIFFIRKKIVTFEQKDLFVDSREFQAVDCYRG